MKTNFRIDIGEVVPGMILNEDISQGGNMLLPKGAVIKPAYIMLLASRGINHVNVCTERSLYKDIIKNPVERFYAETCEDISTIIDGIKKDDLPASPEVYVLVERVLDKVFSNKDSMLLLTGLRGSGDYIYTHSLDVCIYSLIAAKAMKLGYEDTITLGMGALLHDIGKTKISDTILLKKGLLTDEEFRKVKKHSEYGYQLAGSIFGSAHPVTKIILQHHERCDGSGYPFKLKSEETDFLSKIVAVADIYDALVSDKAYRKKVLPHEAAEYLLCISNSTIDPEIADVFLKKITLYPKGCQVLLNTREIAVVLDSNPKMPLRPLLKILTDSDRNPLLEPYEFDLVRHPGVFVVHMFN